MISKALLFTTRISMLVFLNFNLVIITYYYKEIQFLAITNTNTHNNDTNSVNEKNPKRKLKSKTSIVTFTSSYFTGDNECRYTRMYVYRWIGMCRYVCIYIFYTSFYFITFLLFETGYFMAYCEKQEEDNIFYTFLKVESNFIFSVLSMVISRSHIFSLKVDEYSSASIL